MSLSTDSRFRSLGDYVRINLILAYRCSFPKQTCYFLLLPTLLASKEKEEGCSVSALTSLLGRNIRDRDGCYV
jgi:hypothetical protein